MNHSNRLSFLHIHVLDALYREGERLPLDLVFQGGTALHLGHGSPRLSEDLDMLVRRSEGLQDELGGLMERVHAHVQQAALLQYGTDGLTLKTNSRNARGHNPCVFEFRLPGNSPAEAGSVLKVEFFAVEPSVLRQYGRTPKKLHDPLYPHLSPVAPVAQLHEVLLDKLHALSGRRYLKYRDVFDVWWILQSPDVSLEPNTFRSLDVHRSMYADDQSPLEIGRLALNRLESASTAEMKMELGRFLPPSVLSEEAMEAMIQAARSACQALVDSCAPPAASASIKRKASP